LMRHELWYGFSDETGWKLPSFAPPPLLLFLGALPPPKRLLLVFPPLWFWPNP